MASHEMSGGTAPPSVLPDISPSSGRAVRGKSFIYEGHLIGRGSVSWPAWTDRWRLVDGVHFTPSKQVLSDQFCEPQDWNRDAASVRGNAQQRICDHCCKELQANCIVVVAQEFADLEVLLDPAEQK